ncbi:hypothetical protein BH10PAT1_BH10PAT1_5850 [soil metagenome]
MLNKIIFIFSLLFFLLIASAAFAQENIYAQSCSGTLGCCRQYHVTCGPVGCDPATNCTCTTDRSQCDGTWTASCGSWGTCGDNGFPTFCQGGSFANCSQSSGPFCGDHSCNNGETHASCPADCAAASTPAPTDAPVACGWCAPPSQCAAAGGSWSDSHGYCSSSGDGCCATSGGGGGPTNPPPPPPPQYNCGDSCQSDQQCANRNGLAVCYQGTCQNKFCLGATQSGKNCACSQKLSCGQQPIFGQGCDSDSQQGFVNVPDAQSNNCNNYANNSGNAPKGYQYCLPKNPGGGYTFTNNCGDLGVKRMAKPDGSVTGFTSADFAIACQQVVPPSPTPLPSISPALCAQTDKTFVAQAITKGPGGQYTTPTYIPVPAGATGFDLIADDNRSNFDIQFIVNGVAVNTINTRCNYQGSNWYDLCSNSTLFNYEAVGTITSLAIKVKNTDSSNTDTAYLSSLQWEYCSDRLAWWQVTGGDVVTNGDLQSEVTATSPFILDSVGGWPGNVLYGNNFNVFNISSQNWIAKSSYLGKTYDSTYFNNLIPGNVVFNNLSPTAGNSDFSSGSISPDGYYWYKTTGDLTTNSDITIVGNRKVILFVQGGNFNINNKINIQTHGSGYFMAIVGKDSNGNNGNIIVGPGVTAATATAPAIEGVYEADNLFDTGNSNVNLYIRGTVVAWGSVNLQRSLKASNATLPAESIEYDPALIMLFPRSLVQDNITWKEVIP